MFMGGDVMNGFDRITRDPQHMAGFPCIRDFTLAVSTVVNLVASGKTDAEILADYPGLEPEDIRQALAFAAAIQRCDMHLWN
jgi:uncharacterized protein (DUF433 family)